MSALALLLGVVAGVVVAPVAALLVYVDATRRGLSNAVRRRAAAAVGLASASGFLVAAAVDDPLLRLYLTRVKPRPVVFSPLEVLLVTAGVVLVAGLAGSAAAVLLYRMRTGRPAGA